MKRYLTPGLLVFGMLASLLCGCKAMADLKEAQDASDASMLYFLLYSQSRQTTCNTTLSAPTGVPPAVFAQAGLDTYCYYRYEGTGSRTFRVSVARDFFHSDPQALLRLANDGAVPTTAPSRVCPTGTPGTGWSTSCTTALVGTDASLTVTVTAARTIAVYGQTSSSGGSSTPFTLSVE